MLLTAWKHEEWNRHRSINCHVLIFPEVSGFQYKVWQYIAFVRVDLVTILKALIHMYLRVILQKIYQISAHSKETLFWATLFITVDAQFSNCGIQVMEILNQSNRVVHEICIFVILFYLKKIFLSFRILDNIQQFKSLCTVRPNVGTTVHCSATERKQMF